MKYDFRFFRDYRAPLEGLTFDAMRHELRQWAPCTTGFRAIAQGHGALCSRFYIVLRFSPHVIGPMIEGYLYAREA